MMKPGGREDGRAHAARRREHLPAEVQRRSPSALDPGNASPRRLLDRILDAPQLARVVPHLPPDLLHRVIQHCGLEDCGALVALAEPGQLAHVFDLDLWQAPGPGIEERFDIERFGVWLEVLMEAGAPAAAAALAAMDAGLVTTALAQHVRVFDRASVGPYISIDGDVVPGLQMAEGAFRCEIGGYDVSGLRNDSWEAVCAVLIALDAAHREFFARVMRGCVRLSYSPPEVDGLDELLTDRDQAMLDLSLGRERRRDAQGYVTPDQSRAFLQSSRKLRLDQRTQPALHPVAAASLRAGDEAAQEETPAGGSPVTASVEVMTLAERESAVAAVLDVLLDAGVLPGRSRALLAAGEEEVPSLPHLQRHMQWLHEHDAAAHAVRSRELAFLANALVAGCAIQARSMTPQEAADGAAAVCNLGLENWPRQWLAGSPRRAVADVPEDLPGGLLATTDLVTVFQVGWAVLHRDVCMYAAEQLLDALAGFRCSDPETRAGLNGLRRALRTHWRAGRPWEARAALDVIAILDMPAWAALLGLIGEFPVALANVRLPGASQPLSLDPSAFEFIAGNRQIAAVRHFMASLPDVLAG